MAELNQETIPTQDTEVKQVEETKVESVADILPEEPAKETTKTQGETEKTVPLSTYLELKKDLKELKEEIKNSKSSEKESVRLQGIEDIASKYPDVSTEFIQDILGAAKVLATKEIDEKYSPIIEKQENERKQAEFDKAFDNLFEQALNDNPDIPKSVDKDLVKTLALTPKYRNIPISEIMMKLSGSVEIKGKETTENDTRGSGDVLEGRVNFDSMSEDQRKAVMADPAARKKYFDYLDSQPGR